MNRTYRLLALTTLCISAESSIPAQNAPVTNRSDKGWNFELRNRSPLAIGFKLYDNEHNEIFPATYLPEKIAGQAEWSLKDKPSPAVRLVLPDSAVNKHLVLELFVNQDGSFKKTGLYQLNRQAEQLFLTWDNGQLRTQQGRGGKTLSGIPFKGNKMRENDIINIDPALQVHKGIIVPTKLANQSDTDQSVSWDFELRNKSNSDISFKVYQNKHQIHPNPKGLSDNIVLGLEHAHALNRLGSINEEKVNAVRIAPINLFNGTDIEIYDENNSMIGNYFIRPYKKIFVTWENGKLRPQQGVRGRTQSGIPLADKELRLKESDIIKK